jgi:hypothetical protein
VPAAITATSSPTIQASPTPQPFATTVPSTTNLPTASPAIVTATPGITESITPTPIPTVPPPVQPPAAFASINGTATFLPSNGNVDVTPTNRGVFSLQPFFSGQNAVVIAYTFESGIPGGLPSFDSSKQIIAVIDAASEDAASLIGGEIQFQPYYNGNYSYYNIAALSTDGTTWLYGLSSETITPSNPVSSEYASFGFSNVNISIPNYGHFYLVIYAN